ncbi:uncharacterized protein BO95DRAFT_432985 [Aspergillus brunneoviolaceus CBS 621.78]|uniref:Uncharacterized protein n=1 Tax=Aspergillus brunneoviolaceus CBS 621.78 TaxID=1450534 RepID=A0ACD1G5T9_9EURO|nr:hypothetical protein BO95DRAFT_432985 [Aspergillus brunneoviolaceus CBS 621.78]RAH44636.1 hypothetical protein BO95DRAFT_432985 [Aspergillus brunneoviolaceus CBS 621.78]
MSQITVMLLYPVLFALTVIGMGIPNRTEPSAELEAYHAYAMWNPHSAAFDTILLDNVMQGYLREQGSIMVLKPEPEAYALGADLVTNLERLMNDVVLELLALLPGRAEDHLAEIEEVCDLMFGKGLAAILVEEFLEEATVEDLNDLELTVGLLQRAVDGLVPDIRALLPKLEQVVGHVMHLGEEEDTATPADMLQNIEHYLLEEVFLSPDVVAVLRKVKDYGAKFQKVLPRQFRERFVQLTPPGGWTFELSLNVNSGEDEAELTIDLSIQDILNRWEERKASEKVEL